MTDEHKRSTVYFEPELHEALKLKALQTHQTLSALVNYAVRQILIEDQEDLEAFHERVAEPTMDYETLLKKLKDHGKI